MAEPDPRSDAAAPDADTDRIVVVPSARRPTHKSRKFWCVVALTMAPPLNHLTIQMPFDHLLATMFPWAAWGGGEWALDWLKLLKALRTGGA